MKLMTGNWKGNFVAFMFILFVGGMLYLQVQTAHRIKLHAQVELSPSPTIVSLNVAKIDEQFRSMTNQETIITTAWTFVPYPGFYYVLGIAPDGHLNTWRRAATGRQLMFQGNLTMEELAEVSSIMNEMSDLQTSEAMTGSIIINVLSTIESKKYLLSFDELNAPDRLRRLYEISEIAVKRELQEQGLGSIGHEWDPFRNPTPDKK